MGPAARPQNAPHAPLLLQFLDPSLYYVRGFQQRYFWGTSTELITSSLCHHWSGLSRACAMLRPSSLERLRARVVSRALGGTRWTEWAGRAALAGSLPVSATHNSFWYAGLLAGPSAASFSAAAKTAARSRGDGSASAATAGAPASATTSHFKPAHVLVKVGDGLYKSYHVSWETLLRMDDAQLLDALSTSRVFGPSLKDVELAKCTVAIRKGELPEEEEVPPSTDYASPTTFIELAGATKVEKATQKAGCTGDRLFIHVRLPQKAGAAGEYNLEHGG